MEQAKVIEALQAAISAEGSRARFARKHGMSPTFVADVVHGRKDTSKAILLALGLEKVVVYRRKPKVEGAS